MDQAGRVVDLHAHVTPRRFQKAVLAGAERHAILRGNAARVFRAASPSR